MEALHQPEPVRHHARRQFDAAPWECCCTARDEPSPSGQTSCGRIVEPVGAFLDLGMFFEPGVRDGYVGRYFGQVFLRHVTQHGEQRGGKFGVCDEVVIITVVLVSIRLGGSREYRQAPFGYQGKCLKWLRDAYAALSETDRSRVDAVLCGTGCEQLFT